mgnify:CR=1 FL=1
MSLSDIPNAYIDITFSSNPFAFRDYLGTKSDSISPFLPKTSIKRASLVDRFLFKIVNPDGVIEDYITEGDRPGDKYKRLKNQLIKGKNKVYKLVQDIKKRCFPLSMLL